ncbi:aminotransferase class I and II domain-containing protein [Sarocladium implicatum]|nr:aminotransferase class I and II domain-containing protein [Sarocladium implicatum]
MSGNTLFTETAVPEAPVDSHYGLRALYQADDHPNKVNLVIGAYKDDEGQPWVLPVVKKVAAKKYHEDPRQNYEYLPIAGDPSFCKAAARILMGADVAGDSSRIQSFQTISGTGAVHLGAVFLSKFLKSPKVYLSSPTWDNHVPVFTHAGLKVEHYPYYSKETKSLDIQGMLRNLTAAPRGSIVVLQACAHNPTGLDPSQDQWREIATVIQDAGLFPFFDCAYQGFATGDLANDSFAVRHFAALGLEMFIAQSFSKNLGLYAQRTGCLHYLSPCGPGALVTATRVSSQLARLQRAEISTPAAYGAKIASLVLNDEVLAKEWVDDLATMSGRIADMRAELRRRLEELATPGGFEHITGQIGMFAYTGLSEKQVLLIRSKWHVYMLETGRMSVSGLNSGNVGYVAKAIDDVVRSSD